MRAVYKRRAIASIFYDSAASDAEDDADFRRFPGLRLINPVA